MADLCTIIDYGGWTALHFCVDSAAWACLALVLAAPGVDLAARSAQGETAADMAHRRQQESAGADASLDSILHSLTPPS